MSDLQKVKTSSRVERVCGTAEACGFGVSETWARRLYRQLSMAMGSVHKRSPWGQNRIYCFIFTLTKSVFFEQRMTRMESGRCSAATRIFATKPAASQRLVHPSSWPRCSCIIYSGNFSPRADGHFSATKAVHH